MIYERTYHKGSQGAYAVIWHLLPTCNGLNRKFLGSNSYTNLQSPGRTQENIFNMSLSTDAFLVNKVGGFEPIPILNISMRYIYISLQILGVSYLI